MLKHCFGEATHETEGRAILPSVYSQIGETLCFPGSKSCSQKRPETQGTHPVGVDDSQGTSYASHIDPSRNATILRVRRG